MIGFKPKTWKKRVSESILPTHVQMIFKLYSQYCQMAHWKIWTEAFVSLCVVLFKGTKNISLTLHNLAIITVYPKVQPWWPSTRHPLQGVLQCIPRSRFTTSILPSHWTDLDALLQRHRFGCWQSLRLPGAEGSLKGVKIGCWGSSLGKYQLRYESMYGGKLSFCDTLD